VYSTRGKRVCVCVCVCLCRYVFEAQDCGKTAVTYELAN